jgi:hypothetical protein
MSTDTQEYQRLLAAWKQAAVELHVHVATMQAKVPIRQGDVVRDRSGNLMTVTEIKFFIPYNNWPARPKWFVTGLKHKKDGTVGLREETLIYEGVEQVALCDASLK